MATWASPSLNPISRDRTVPAASPFRRRAGRCGQSPSPKSLTKPRPWASTIPELKYQFSSVPTKSLAEDAKTTATLKSSASANGLLALPGREINRSGHSGQSESPRDRSGRKRSTSAGRRRSPDLANQIGPLCDEVSPTRPYSSATRQSNARPTEPSVAAATPAVRCSNHDP